MICRFLTNSVAHRGLSDDESVEERTSGDVICVDEVVLLRLMVPHLDASCIITVHI